MVASIKGVSPSVTGTVSGNLGTWPVNGSLTPQMPGGAGAPAAGDLLLMPVYVRVATATINDLSGDGWVRLTTAGFTTGANTAELWAKIAAGGDAAPALTTSPTGQPTGAIIIVIEDWSGDLVDLVATIQASTSANVTCPDVTTPEDDSLVVRIGLQQDDNQSATNPQVDPPPPPFVPWDTPAGHTALFYEVTQAASDAGMAAAWEVVATAGSAGTGVFATNGNDAGIGISVAIPPDGDVPPAEGELDTEIVLDAALTGARASAGALTAPVELDALLTGSAPAQGSVATPLVLDASLTGARASAGALTAPLSLDCQVSGARESVGVLVVPLVLDIDVSGLADRSGTLTTPLVLDASITGSNGEAGRPVAPYPFTPEPVPGWPFGTEPLSSYPWTPRPVRSFQEVGEP